MGKNQFAVSDSVHERPLMPIPGPFPLPVSLDALRVDSRVFVFAYVRCAFNGVKLSLTENARRNTNDARSLTLILQAPHTAVVLHDHPLSSEYVLDSVPLDQETVTVTIQQPGFYISHAPLTEENCDINIRSEKQVTPAELIYLLSKTPGRVMVPTDASEKSTAINEWKKLGVMFKGGRSANVSRSEDSIPERQIKPIPIAKCQVVRALAVYDDVLSQHCSTSCSKVTDEGFGFKTCTEYRTVCQHLRNSLLLTVTVELDISEEDLSEFLDASLTDSTIAGLFTGLVTTYATDGDVAAGYAAGSAAFLAAFQSDMEGRFQRALDAIQVRLVATLTTSSEWV